MSDEDQLSVNVDDGLIGSEGEGTILLFRVLWEDGDASQVFHTIGEAEHHLGNYGDVAQIQSRRVTQTYSVTPWEAVSAPVGSQQRTGAPKE